MLFLKKIRRSSLYIVLLIFLLGVLSPSHAANKNGVSPNTISLPSGPGSIEGLGKAFQPMLNTGTASYEVAFALPGGVNGHTPSLSLSYDSGLGDGPAGIGWSIGPGSIRRQTEKGIPRYVHGPNGEDDDRDGEYDEPDEEDKFIGLEKEELIPLPDGTYRARIEGHFIRYRLVGDHWEAHLKDGSKLEFGLTPAGRIADRKGTRIYAWLLEKNTDTSGNVIKYIYTGFPGSDNQKYLKEIRYGPGADPWAAFYFASLTYEDRPDWRKDYRSGFLIKTSKRLVRIDIGAQGISPPQCAEGDWNSDKTGDALIRSYILSYKNNEHWSFLSKITEYGSDGNDFLPPISFTYATFEPDSSVSAQEVVIGSANEPLSVMDSQFVELIDLDRDSLPDVLKTDLYGGGHTCYINRGIRKEGNKCRMQWDNGQDVINGDGLALQLHLLKNRVHLADMDGDGISDLVHTTYNDEVFYHLNLGDISWGNRRRMSIQDTSPPAPFASELVKTSDLDFNKQIDIVKSSENGYSIWFNLGKDKYSREVRTPGAVYQGQTILFSESGVKLADINGDRMNDIVRIRPTHLVYCANMGHGYFDSSVNIDIPDETLTDGPNGHIAKSEMQDINGDGLADLVVEHAGSNELWYWLNLGTDTLSHKHVITNIPANYEYDRVTRWADINGNGTKDLIYADSFAMPRLRAIDIGELVGGSAHPNLLTGIDNGLGVITQISYRSSTEFYIEAQEAGNPWTSVLPFPVSVVSQVETTTSLDFDTIPGKDTYVKEYIYRDGYYDYIEKAFRGFAQVTVIEYGDSSAPAQVTTHHFFTGGPDGVDNDGDKKVDEIINDRYREDEPLKGKVRAMEVASEDGLIFNKAENDWRIKNLLKNIEGIEVCFAFNQEQRTLIYEGTDSPKTLSTTYVYDDFGHVIEEKNYGALSISGDEVFTYTTHINNTGKWILGLVSRQYTTNIAGQKMAETFNYYDGQPYVGLELGVVEKGNLTRQEGWVTEDRYINLIRNAFDPFGNIIGIMDGNGYLREVEYDPVFHIFPITETIEVDEEPEKLTITAEYNLGLGVMTQGTDFNGHTTSYYYNSFGDLVKIINPGDSLEYPTQRFIYTIADPHRGLLYSYDDEGNLAITSDIYTLNSVITKTREQFGQPGTFDSIQYTDGLGRSLALVEEAEEGFVLKDAVLFNAKGTPRYAFLPYRISSSDYYPPSLSRHYIETHYDATGREIAQINPPGQDGILTRSSTEYLPLQTNITDENNNTKTFIHDGLERLIEVHERNNQETYITHYDYDALGNLIKITDAQNNVKTMYYDALGRKTQTNDPDSGRILYEYDDLGNLVKTTDNKDQVILYTYDGANRMLTEDYLDEAGINPDIIYHYDHASTDYPEASNLKGALSWVKDLSGSRFFSYDQRGNTVWTVKRIDQGGSLSDYKTAMTYDAMGRVVSMTYPDGDIISYAYNNRTLLKSIPRVVKSINYTASGRLDSIAFANDMKTSYTYDSRQRLTNLQTKNTLKGNLILQDLSYAFDGVSNITAITDGRDLPTDSPKNASQAFQYDGLYRLTQAQGPGYGVINYHYDRIGNMILKKSPAPPDPGHINDPLINLGAMSYGGTGGANNRSGKLPGDPPGPHAITSTESDLQYEYDDNGNMISHAKGDLYTWDFTDRLIKVQKNDTVSHYLYDYTGQRVIKKVIDNSGEKISLYVSNAYEIREGQVIKYVFAGDKRVARIEGSLISPDETKEQTLTFQPGWNLFSLEVEPDDPAIEIVLSPIQDNFTEVWAFDPLVDEYQGYAPGQGIYDLSELHAQQGYLIKITSACSLVITGIINKDDILLSSGWNLIACPSNRTLALAESLVSIAGKIVSIWSYNTPTGEWRCYAPEAPDFINDLEEMEPGKAYWVKMNKAGQLAYISKPTKEIYFYHQDHLGSSNLVTDLNGTVVESTEFYPFGRTRSEEHLNFNSTYKYTSKELDKESGLMYYRARYYDSVVGRFISVDPLGVKSGDPQSINKYVYCRNNPLKYVDPKGMQFSEGALSYWISKNALSKIMGEQNRSVIQDPASHQVKFPSLKKIFQGAKVEGGILTLEKEYTWKIKNIKEATEFNKMARYASYAEAAYFSFPFLVAYNYLVTDAILNALLSVTTVAPIIGEVFSKPTYFPNDIIKNKIDFMLDLRTGFYRIDLEQKIIHTEKQGNIEIETRVFYIEPFLLSRIQDWCIDCELLLIEAQTDPSIKLPKTQEEKIEELIRIHAPGSFFPQF